MIFNGQGDSLGLSQSPIRKAAGLIVSHDRHVDIDFFRLQKVDTLKK
jgi:hypothetical protein